MNFNKYVLDRYDEEFGVFLLVGDEKQQLLIPKEKINIQISEGDIVQISEEDKAYAFYIEENETNERKKRAERLLEKLQNKRHKS